MMPKRGCDVSTCEVARFYRLNNSGLCQVISMTVPRKSELFQEDLYPDTLSDEASVSAEDWISGADADPQLVSLKGGYVSQAQSTQLTVTKKSNVLDKMPPRGPKSGPPTSASPPAGATTTTSNGSPASNGTSSPATQANATSQQQAAPVVINGVSEQALTDLRTKFEDEFRKLKAIIVKHENRIRSLEATIKAMADRGQTETDGALLNTSTPSPTITAANQSANPQDDHHGDGSSHYTNTNLAPDEV